MHSDCVRSDSTVQHTDKCRDGAVLVFPDGLHFDLGIGSGRITGLDYSRRCRPGRMMRQAPHATQSGLAWRERAKLREARGEADIINHHFLSLPGIVGTRRPWRKETAAAKGKVAAEATRRPRDVLSLSARSYLPFLFLFFPKTEVQHLREGASSSARDESREFPKRPTFSIRLSFPSN